VSAASLIAWWSTPAWAVLLILTALATAATRMRNQHQSPGVGTPSEHQPCETHEQSGGTLKENMPQVIARTIGVITAQVAHVLPSNQGSSKGYPLQRNTSWCDPELPPSHRSLRQGRSRAQSPIQGAQRGPARVVSKCLGSALVWVCPPAPARSCTGTRPAQEQCQRQRQGVQLKQQRQGGMAWLQLSMNIDSHRLHTTQPQCRKDATAPTTQSRVGGSPADEQARL